MATPEPAPPDRPRRSTPLRPGGVEDRYRSLFVIGRGGMGSVEVALERADGGFERVVALKRLLPEGARDPRHKEMFLREARLAALLSHANVVHAFAFGELYGELFLAMEYVEGEPLSRLIMAAQNTGQALAPNVVALVLAEVCDGLHAAHELFDAGGHPLNVVHRDVSPHNVMVAYDGHVKILDFGVAKFETGGHETRTGEVKGKMAYMSPQQALGEKLDRRSDLFSIGAVLFECLTGRRMWGTGTDLEVMRRLALEAPPRLDEAMSDAPAALVDLHARLVAREPDRRPATAREVGEELRAYLRSSSPPTDGSAVRALMQRLFAADAARRRSMLTTALERAAPTRVDVLRRTLDPATAFDLPTITEPVIVQSPSEHPETMAPKRPNAARPSRRALALLVIATALVGGGVAAAAKLKRGERPTATSASGSPAAALAPSPSPSASPAPSTALASPSPPPSQSSSPLSPSHSASPSVSLAPAPPPARSPGTFAEHPRPHPSPKTPPATNRLPDVDPTPF